MVWRNAITSGCLSVYCSSRLSRRVCASWMRSAVSLVAAPALGVECAAAVASPRNCRSSSSRPDMAIERSALLFSMPASRRRCSYSSILSPRNFWPVSEPERFPPSTSSTKVFISISTTCRLVGRSRLVYVSVNTRPPVPASAAEILMSLSSESTSATRACGVFARRSRSVSRITFSSAGRLSSDCLTKLICAPTSCWIARSLT